MSRVLFIYISFLLALTANAQSEKFLDNLRRNESGKAKVTVTQSAEIDALINGKGGQKQTPTTVNATATTTKQPQHNTAKEENTKPETPAASATNTVSRGEDDAPEENVVIDTRKKIMRNSYKTKGYRIQVYSGGNSHADKLKAEQAGNDMKRLFPTEPVYVHFYSPSWKCRMGNYKTAEEARKILTQVKKHYRQACLVKGTISVQY